MNSSLRMVLLSVVAWAVMLGATGSDASEFGLGARAENARERAYVDAVYREVRSVEPNPLARERASAELNADMRTASLALSDRPSAADNSTLPWFPPIGNQGYQNSCVGWAAGYYYNTYVQAMDEAIDVSGWDP